MKHTLLICFLILSFSSVLFSQEDTTKPADKELFVWGGISFPYLPREFNDFWKNGWNIGGGYGYSFEPGSIGYGALHATVEYARFAFDSAGVSSTIRAIDTTYKNLTSTGRPTSIFDVMLQFKGAFSTTKQSVAPYFLLGIGYMFYSAGSVTVSGDTSFVLDKQQKSKFLWSVGVGIEIPFSESLGMFVQAKSILGVIDPTRQYFPLSAGIMIRP